MTNPILSRIQEIDKRLSELHHEGAALRALQNSHIQDIDNRKAKAESDYDAQIARIDQKTQMAINAHKTKVDTFVNNHKSALASIDRKDDNAKATYNSISQSVSDADISAYEKCAYNIAANSQAIKNKFDGYARKDKEYIVDLENKIRICSNGNQKLVQQYGVANGSIPSKPDLQGLYSLFDRIMTDTADSMLKRTFKRDGYYAQGDMVRDFIKGATEAIAYLKYEIAVILPDHCNTEIKRITASENAIYNSKTSSGEITKKDAEKQLKREKYQNDQLRQQATSKHQQDLSALAILEKQIYSEDKRERELAADKKRQELIAISNLEKKYIAEEETKITPARKRKDAFFETDLVLGFADVVKNSTTDSGFVDSDWNSYDVRREPSKHYVLGNVYIPLKTESKPLLSMVSQTIPSYFNGTSFSVPLLIPNESAVKLYLQYDIKSKKSACEHVQLLILQKMRSNPANHLNVYFADPNDRGQNMGALIASNEENEAIGVYSNNTKDGIKSVLSSVVDLIDNMNGKLGSLSSLYEYNKQNDSSLKETILVLCDVQDCITQETLPLLKVIWENAQRCGINILLTSEVRFDKLNSLEPNSKMDWSFIDSDCMLLVHSANNECSIRIQNVLYRYELADLNTAHISFLTKYRSCYAESLKIENRFSALHDKMLIEAETNEQRHYGKAYDGIRLPIFIDTESNSICKKFVLGTENSQHMLVTGGTGSGKSRLLHSLIASIVMNYHPDDVELWLIDCKKVEFELFMRLRPQHIRMVSLERTKEFAFAFFDYLFEFAQNRTRTFVNEGVTNLKDYRKKKNDPYCMPRVVIIIDEFHAITEHLMEDLKYRQMLEDALSEYRNLGISFVFSDQSISTNRGLTDKAKQQIHYRIAMRGTIDEMKYTLGVMNDSYTQSILSEMENSEGRGDVWWNKGFGIRYKNVYMSSERDEKTMHNSSEEEVFLQNIINSCPIAKQDTKLYLIDGRNRTAFEDSLAKEYLHQGVSNSMDVMQFCIGAPTTLEDSLCFDLKQRYNNNVLISGRDVEMAASVMASMLKSAAIINSYRVIVFADVIDEKYSMLKPLLRVHPMFEVYDDYESICRVINDLHSEVKSKRPLKKKTLVFWLGLTDMYDEFCVSPEKSEIEGYNTDEKRSGGFSADEEKAINDPVLQDMAKNMGLSVEDMLEFLSQFEDREEKNAQENECCYNATKDMLDMFAFGGKFGLFNVVSLDFSNDIKRIKGFNTDNFMQKIAFSMSRDESAAWGYRMAACQLEEGLTALYTDGVNQKTFRPYKL